jgi:hypothetical protein
VFLTRCGCSPLLRRPRSTLPYNQLLGTLPASLGDLGPALHTLCVRFHVVLCHPHAACSRMTPF